MSRTINHPAKLIAIAVAIALAAALALSAFGTAAAQAASGSERECDLLGGMYVKDGSNSICVEPEESVANENANPDNNGQTTQTTTNGQGNLGNKTEEECAGPPGQCR